MGNSIHPVVIDLFSGCGGLSLGLHKAGWRGLFAVEKCTDAFETLKYNLIDNKTDPHFQWPKSFSTLLYKVHRVGSSQNVIF